MDGKLLRFSIGYHPSNPNFLYRKQYPPVYPYIGKFKDFVAPFIGFIKLIPLELVYMDIAYRTYKYLFVGLSPNYPNDFKNEFKSMEYIKH